MKEKLGGAAGAVRRRWRAQWQQRVALEGKIEAISLLLAHSTGKACS